MAEFTYKKEVSLYLVHNSKQYKLDISEITFNQRFQEASYPVKTLHTQDFFEGSVINRARPADFDFTVPLLQEVRNKVVYDRLLDIDTFDLYISTQQDDFKLEKCVIVDGVFEIKRSKPLSLTVSGEASKLSKFTGTIPGVAQNTSITTSTYIVPKPTTVDLGGVDISPSIFSLSIELDNDISWTKYNTVQGGLAATNAATSMYPTSFTVGTKTLSGSISRYLLKDSPKLFEWSKDTSIRIKVGSKAPFYGIDLNISNCSFTNRVKPSNIFSESYDWRMIQNPTTLSSVLTYNTT